MEPILECFYLTKLYGSKVGLNGFNLAFPKGKIIGLLGPNGSGKTTLIKLATGLLAPTSGKITVGGLAPGKETKAFVSYLPERSYLSSWMTVNDSLDLFSDMYADFNRKKAEDMLGRLGIKPDAKYKTLSKGTKEKVQLVLVMSRRARLYLLDEPIGGVDPAAREYILDTIISNYSEDSTILISTHLIADIESVLDEYVFINNGRITASGSVDAVREERGISIDALFREVFRC